MMKLLDALFLLLGLIAATGALVMWAISIHQKAPFDERSYWLLVFFVMSWISDKQVSKHGDSK